MSARILSRLGLLLPLRMLRALMLGLALFAVSVPADAAKLKFGSDEELRHLLDVDIKGQKGEALYLGHKLSIHWFGLSYAVSDEGYVLGIKGQTSYYSIEPAQLKSWQASGHLPDPLPKYELSVFDYIFGHLLWIFLAATAAWYAFRFCVPAPVAVAEPVVEPQGQSQGQSPAQLPAKPDGRVQTAVALVTEKIARAMTVLRGTPPPPRGKLAQIAPQIVAFARLPDQAAAKPVDSAAANPTCSGDLADVQSMPVARVVCKVKQLKAA